MKEENLLSGWLLKTLNVFHKADVLWRKRFVFCSCCNIFSSNLITRIKCCFNKPWKYWRIRKCSVHKNHWKLSCFGLKYLVLFTLSWLNRSRCLTENTYRRLAYNCLKHPVVQYRRGLGSTAGYHLDWSGPDESGSKLTCFHLLILWWC